MVMNTILCFMLVLGRNMIIHLQRLQNVTFLMSECQTYTSLLTFKWDIFKHLLLNTSRYLLNVEFFAFYWHRSVKFIKKYKLPHNMLLDDIPQKRGYYNITVSIWFQRCKRHVLVKDMKKRKVLTNRSYTSAVIHNISLLQFL